MLGMVAHVWWRMAAHAWWLTHQLHSTCMHIYIYMDTLLALHPGAKQSQSVLLQLNSLAQIYWIYLWRSYKS